MITERSKEFAAGELIRELIAAIRRRDLFQDVVTPQRDVEPTDASKNRGRQEVFFHLAPFLLFARNAYALAEAQEQSAMTQDRPRRAFEIGIADFRMNDIDEFLMNFRIVDAG